MPMRWLYSRAANTFNRMNDLYPNDEAKLSQARTVLQQRSRDNGRTPMQWDDSPNAGFCPADVKPWMRVNDDYPKINAAAQLVSSGSGRVSVFQFWKRLLKFRKAHVDVLVYGDFEAVHENNSKIFAYLRKSASGCWLSVLNFTGEHVEWDVPSSLKIKQWVLCNYEDPRVEEHGARTVISIRPWEGLLGQGE